MTCNVCGRTYTDPSLGGPGICPSCDCGYKPDGTKLTARESFKIAERYKLGLTPYYQPPANVSDLIERLKGGAA